MPLSFLSQLRMSLAFRLTIWYAASFIIIGGAFPDILFLPCLCGA